jgi:uncharacterized membrane protein
MDQKRRSADYHLKRWRIQAPVGLIVVGFGVCLIAEASNLKFSDAPALHWVAAGTGALVVFNAGLCLFGDSILHRVRYERLVASGEAESSVR